MNDDALSQIDAEIERLRRQKPKNEADPKWTEIETSISGLQWLRDKYANRGSGDRTLHGIGNRGQLVDVPAMRERWEKHKMYKAVPEGAQMMLHLLARGAQHAAPEDATALLAKLVEILEFVWPTSSAQEHTAVTVGKIVILVPNEPGVPLGEGI